MNLSTPDIDIDATNRAMAAAGFGPADCIDADCDWWVAYPLVPHRSPVGVATDDTCQEEDGTRTWYLIDGNSERDGTYAPRSLEAALIEAVRLNAPYLYRVTATPSSTTVLADDGEGEVTVTAAEVTVTCDGSTWSGTVTCPDHATSLDVWISGALFELARAQVDVVGALREAYLQAARGRTWAVTVEVEK